MFIKQNQDAAAASNRSIATSALSLEFDNFLYAPIGEVNDEIPLSVLSALARQNVDPWAEAAELTRLSRESATVRLTAVISAVTAEASTGREPAANAARLIALLPRSVGFTMPRYDQPPSDVPRNVTPIIIYLIVGAIIIASALLGH